MGDIDENQAFSVTGDGCLPDDVREEVQVDQPGGSHLNESGLEDIGVLGWERSPISLGNGAR
jgi:hypothetical protein